MGDWLRCKRSLKHWESSWYKWIPLSCDNRCPYRDYRLIVSQVLIFSGQDVDPVDLLFGRRKVVLLHAFSHVTNEFAFVRANARVAGAAVIEVGLQAQHLLAQRGEFWREQAGA